MRVLLDTHVLIALTKDSVASTYPAIAAVLTRPDVETVVSVVSLWEIAIKTRLGKLAAGIAIKDLATFLEQTRIGVLSINPQHVVTDVLPAPRTSDPFDYLLLAICQVEMLRLATVDSALAGHPLVLETF